MSKKTKQKQAKRKHSDLPVGKKKRKEITGIPRWVRMQLKFKKVKGFDENKEAPQ